MKDRLVALTTVDNPFDPINDFLNWFRFDTEKGYNSCSYLDRIAKTSYQLTEKEYDEEVERAIDEIVKEDPFGIYIKFVTNN